MSDSPWTLVRFVLQQSNWALEPTKNSIVVDNSPGASSSVKALGESLGHPVYSGSDDTEIIVTARVRVLEAKHGPEIEQTFTE